MNPQIEDLPHFVRDHKFKLANILEDSDDPLWTDRVEDAPPWRANLISSEATVSSFGFFNDKLPDNTHRPLIDLDMNAALIPSSSPGHFHLYIDKTMPWEDYEKLLKTLLEVGIIQPGVYENAVKRQFTSLRLPGISKYDHLANNPFPVDGDLSEIALLRREIATLKSKLESLEGPPF